MEILPIAVKVVSWDVSPLDTLKNSRAYMLRETNGNGKMDRTEKNWLAENIKNNSYFRTSIPLMGYRFDFADVLRKYLVNQYGQWSEDDAPDKTSLRNALYGTINKIIK